MRSRSAAGASWISTLPLPKGLSKGLPKDLASRACAKIWKAASPASPAATSARRLQASPPNICLPKAGPPGSPEDFTIVVPPCSGEPHGPDLSLRTLSAMILG